MAPHLERAQDAYKGLHVHAFITHTHIYKDPPPPPHTHTHTHNKYMVTCGRKEKREMRNQYAEEERWVFSFDLEVIVRLIYDQNESLVN